MLIFEGMYFLGGFMCFGSASDIHCKVSLYLAGVFTYLPDWLAVPLSVDRLVAIQFPITYKQKATQRSAWVAIIPLVVITLALFMPKSLEAHVGRKNDCDSDLGSFDTFLSLSGVGAIASVIIFTSALLAVIAMKKNQKRGDSRKQREVVV